MKNGVNPDAHSETKPRAQAFDDSAPSVPGSCLQEFQPAITGTRTTTVIAGRPILAAKYLHLGNNQPSPHESRSGGTIFALC
ncbi:hypothetical protein [Gimesia maris]|uniref:hypothetical protein n=1 Tax=Gimesia maris TaxID=122 RepID=UPI0012B93F95|nr:hypothetical protein [Gimesia maris]